MTTHVWGTDGSEVSVWDTAGSRVWGPDGPGPDPDPWPWPATEDQTILQMRPVVSSSAVYEVGAGRTYESIGAAFAAIDAVRASLQIAGGGAGPQDFALVRIDPGQYRERLRPPNWTALVSATGDPADVRVWADFTDGIMNPVLNPSGPCYVEGIHFDGLAAGMGEPNAGEAPATIWLVNGAPGATVTLVNILSTSNNEWLNTGAWQAGDGSSVVAYKSQFEMSDGSQPVNAQTSQAWRSMTPAHHCDYIHVECEASCPEGLVVGIADLGYGARDRFIWTGGTIHDSGSNDAQFFHAPINQANRPDNPYDCQSFCTPQVSFAGDPTAHTWAEPSDLAVSLPVGGVAPGSRSYYYPQGLDTVGTLTTAASNTTMTMQAGRWYLVPVQVPEARTLAGFSLEVTSGSGGTMAAALWAGQLRGATFFETTRSLKPERWLSLGATAPISTGVVTIGRGTYQRARIYPGPQVWVGVKVDTACTVRASSTLAAGGLALYQDSATVPATPVGTPLTGPVPVPLVLTGVV